MPLYEAVNIPRVLGFLPQTTVPSLSMHLTDVLTT